MRPHLTIDPANPGQYLNRARYILATVMIVALAVLPIVVVRAFQVEQLLHAANLQVTDDQTWVTSQLEVDYLKFALALAELRSETSTPIVDVAQLEGWPEVQKRFDIFYSRIGTVESKIGNWSDVADAWHRNQGMLNHLLTHRTQLEKVMDEAAVPGVPVNLDMLDGSVDAAAHIVRDLSVSTLSLLADQSNARRLEYIRQFRAVLTQMLSVVLVMVLTSLGAWLLYRQIGVRAAAEHRMNENVRRIVHEKPDAVLVTDSHNRILRMNGSATELFGISEAEAQGHDAVALFFPGVWRRAKAGNVHPLSGQAPPEKAQTFRDIIRRADGEALPVEVTRIQLMTESGNDTTVLYVRNISETQRALRALRRERRRAEAEASRYQRFLAVMSHEIRSPLHAIIASLDLARQKPEAAPLADLHDIAMNAAQVALNEADAVLDIGRAENQMRAAERVIFSPAKIVRDLVEMSGPAAHSAGTKLSVHIGPGADATILGTRACFWHAVSNLLSNALKFARGGSVRLRLTRNDGELRVEVIDNGPGISPEMRDLIFKDHFTLDTKYSEQHKGAGLGLGVFVAAVGAMSGQYGLDSEVGRGCTFWFTFPALSDCQPAQDLPPVEAPTTAPLTTGLRVLVVDDSEINLILMQQMLATLGLRADLANSGAEAVELAKTVAYDLILMDLSMPDMDGNAAASLIRQESKSRRAGIVALTANLLALHERDDPGSVFDEILLKPLRIDGLRQALSLGAQRPPAPVEETSPVIDQDIAQDLLEMLPASAIEPLLTSLFEEANKLLRDLDQGDSADNLSRRFHRLAGSAGMLGARRLRALALAGELRCKDSTQLPTPAFMARWTMTIGDTSRDWAALLGGAAE